MGKIVDFENHFYSQKFLDFLLDNSTYPYYEEEEEGYILHYGKDVQARHKKDHIGRLMDLGEARIAEMDKAGIDIQILSLSEPSVAWIENAKLAAEIAYDANNQIAEAISKYPNRYRGFATISPKDVDEGVKELERCISQHQFIGWLTHSNYGEGAYLDDDKYRPLLKKAAELNIPVYIHPMIPTQNAYHKYSFALAGPTLGFEADTTLCVMRMILGGVFDEFPQLKIIVGHLGETLPYLMERLDFSFVQRWFSEGPIPSLKRIPSEILKENIFITTSGRYYEPALAYVIKSLGPDCILLGSDYPYERMEDDIKFIQESKIADEDKNKILFENAKIFLNI